MSDNPCQTPESDVTVTDTDAVKMSLAQIRFFFEGRINRRTDWLHCMLPTVLLAMVFGFVIGVMELDENVILIFCAIIIRPSLAIQAKRCRDTNRSAWWILTGVVPIIGSLWALVVNGFLGSVNRRQSFWFFSSLIKPSPAPLP